MSATTTEQETTQAEQEPTNDEATGQAEPTIEDRLARVEDVLAEHLCEAIEDKVKQIVWGALLKSVSQRVEALEFPTAQPIYGELVSSASDNVHMRISTKQTAKGFQFETAVSIDGPDAADVRERVEQLLYQTNDLARDECARLDAQTQSPAAAAAQAALDARKTILDEASGDEPDIAR